MGLIYLLILSAVIGACIYWYVTNEALDKDGEFGFLAIRSEGADAVDGEGSPNAGSSYREKSRVKDQVRPRSVLDRSKEGLGVHSLNEHGPSDQTVTETYQKKAGKGRFRSRFSVSDGESEPVNSPKFRVRQSTRDQSEG